MSDSVTKQVQGVNTGEMVKGDWSEFHIDVGRQYPVKLATKRDEVKQAARSAGANVAVWTFNETNGNPNPHKPGEFFKNRYLESVDVGGQLDPNTGQTSIPVAQGGGGVSAPQMPSGRDEGTNRSIERQTIVKAMVPIYAAVNSDGTPLFPDKKYWWAEVYKLDDFMVNGRPAETPPPDESSFIPTAAQDDDDIPF